MSNGQLVGTVQAKWGRIDIFKVSENHYKPVMVHFKKFVSKALPAAFSLRDALDHAHLYVKSDPFARMSADPFTKIEPDVMPYQKVKDRGFSFDERMEDIDKSMQEFYGGIKPMSEQFPGEGSDHYSMYQGYDSRMRKMSAGEVKGAATVAVIHGGHLLMGKTPEGWTCPGGHLNQGEDPHTGALRELFEESGIRASKLSPLVSKTLPAEKGHVTVHGYKLELSEKLQANSFNDPDKEVSEWRWIDVSKGLPQEIASNLKHSKNIILQALGLQSDQYREEIRRFQ